MSWGPLPAAHTHGSDAGHVGDSNKHPPASTLAPTQAGQALLRGNGLPGRWAGRQRFVVLDTDFGLGHNFLATWHAWQQDAQRCSRLWYLAIAAQPPQRADLAHAHMPTNPAGAAALPTLAAALLRQWPPRTPDMHLLDFDAGQVRLLLAFGALAKVLPELIASVDAFYLQGATPDSKPLVWDAWRLRQLTRLAAPGATLASQPVANAVRQGLLSAGFTVQPQPDHSGPGAPNSPSSPGSASNPDASDIPDITDGDHTLTVARFAPRVQAQVPPGRLPLAGVRTVAVVGAGLAGAAVAAALAGRGLAVQVVDRQAGPAGETSGNAGGLFHGVAHAQDGIHARWLRAAALHTARVLRPLVASGQVAGAVGGLLRGEQTLAPGAMQQLLATLALPADFLQVLPQASSAAQTHLSAQTSAQTSWQTPPPAGLHPAPQAQRASWLYPDGGWVDPAALCAHWLGQAGIRVRYGQPVQQLRRNTTGWQLLGSDGQVLAEADAVVLCNAADAQRLAGGDTSPNAADGAGKGAGNGAAARAAPDAASAAAARWPLQQMRGQTSLLPAGLPGAPALPWPLADGGYVLQLADGRLLCGATAQRDDHDPSLRLADHQHNLATLQRLTGWVPALDADPTGRPRGLAAAGRRPPAAAGAAARYWRLHAHRRGRRGGLRRAGPGRQGTGRRQVRHRDGHHDGPRPPDQPRRVPRQPGLYVFTALGSRGITQAALGAEVLASWLTGDPMPAPAALVDALDVARFSSRAVRRASRPPV